MSTSTDDFLAHYGVPGMKWGKRSGGSRKETRQAKNAKIHGARRAQEARLRNLQEAEGDFYVARTNKGKDKAEKIMRKREKDFFTNPDAKTAAKLTSGEKWAVGLTYGLLGASLASSIAASRSLSR